MQEMTKRITKKLARLADEHYDSCCLCNYKFKRGDTSHLGYDKNKKPLYVCDKCSSQLAETAIRYYFEPRPYILPPDKTFLWRYMDFSKYVSLISTKSLYFSRSDCFKDAFEGAKGLKRRKIIWDAYYAGFFCRAIETAPGGIGKKLSTKEIVSQANNLLQEMNQNGNEERKHCFISCWHENDIESEAMWSIYSHYIENAIAIRTTFKSLKECFGENSNIAIGRVNYIDFEKSFAGVNESFWYKRKSFEYEKEVRAIIRNYKTESTGIELPVDLSKLLLDVYVSPYSPEWFYKVVQSVTKQYGVKCLVSQSRLIQEPFY